MRIVPSELHQEDPVIKLNEKLPKIFRKFMKLQFQAIHNEYECQ